MQDLEYTPSIYLPSTQKNNLSAELLFELTATAHKNLLLPIDALPDFTQLSPKLPPNANDKLKTEDFFEEFDNNFVITFEEERPLQEDLTKTATFHLEVESHCLHHSKTTEIGDAQQRRRETFGDLKLLSLKTGMSLMRHAQLQEKGSPVSFEVKKRTVFKAKENIVSNGQNFKLTHKKIFNQSIFQQFTTKSKNHNHSQARSQKSLPSKPELPKGARSNRPDEPSLASRPTLLQRHCGQERSSTLKYWRKRFKRERRGMEGRVRRDNIFQLHSMR